MKETARLACCVAGTGPQEIVQEMEIGETVIWRGRTCIVRGFTPMGVPDRQVDLEDAETGEQLRAPLDEVAHAGV